VEEQFSLGEVCLHGKRNTAPLADNLLALPTSCFIHSPHLLITTIALELVTLQVQSGTHLCIPNIGYGVLALYQAVRIPKETLGGILRLAVRIASTISGGRFDLVFFVQMTQFVRNMSQSPHERSFLLGAACHGCLLLPRPVVSSRTICLTVLL